MSIFLRGLLIGFSIAAPVGPIGVLCIKRTLTEGRIPGLISGLGAASADSIYGMIAAFGLTFISKFLVAQASWFNIVGGIFLCFLGLRNFISKPGDEKIRNNQRGLLGNYFSVFFLTLTNPITILSFAAVFAGFGLTQGDGEYSSALKMVLGVFLGSTLWWLILSQGVGIFRQRLSPVGIVWINRISGVVIFSFGIIALFGLFGPHSPL